VSVRAGDDALEARWFDLARLDKADVAMSSGVHDIAQQDNRLMLTEAPIRDNKRGQSP